MKNCYWLKASLTTLTIKYILYIMSFHRKYNSLFKVVDNSIKLYKMHKKKKQEEKKKNENNISD